MNSWDHFMLPAPLGLRELGHRPSGSWAESLRRTELLWLFRGDISSCAEVEMSREEGKSSQSSQ